MSTAAIWNHLFQVKKSNRNRVPKHFVMVLPILFIDIQTKCDERFKLNATIEAKLRTLLLAQPKLLGRRLCLGFCDVDLHPARHR
jgi:hypothetical protein